MRDYQYDIAHYASSDIKVKTEKCFFSLPEQLSKSNHKFQFSAVEKGSSARKYSSSVDWVVNADMANPCHNVSKLEYPLDSFVNEGNFRLYPCDMGLFTSMFDYSVKSALIDDSGSDPVLLQAKGGIYEALISEMLYKNGHKKQFFYKNDTTGIEIEFLIHTDDGVSPIEVKAKNRRTRSLDRVLKDENIRFGYKLIDGNIGQSEKKITLPLYMAMFI